MNENHRLIEHFYQCFQRKDYRGMAACYHPEASFSDAAFDLKTAAEIAAMWHYLCVAGKDLVIEFNAVQAGEQSGSAHWEARYTFSRTGRKVHNIIEAQFLFRNGKIIRHTDVFSFRRWSQMALGPVGYLLGWSSFLQNKVRATAMHGLRQFIGQHPEYQTPGPETV